MLLCVCVQSDEFILLSGDSLGAWPLQALLGVPSQCCSVAYLSLFDVCVSLSDVHRQGSAMCSALLAPQPVSETKPSHKTKKDASACPDDSALVCLQTDSNAILSIRGFEGD